MCLGAVTSAAIASFKNRSVGGWAVAGALVPLIAVIVLLASETRPDELGPG